MSIFKLNKEFYDKPIRLEKEKKDNPYLAFNDFFDAWGPLSAIRQDIENLLYVALTLDEDIYETARHRTKVISFCIKLEELIEAAYLLKNEKRGDLTSELKS